jgi:hypothetical protein
MDPDIEPRRVTQTADGVVEGGAVGAQRGAGHDALAMAMDDAGIHPRVQAEVVGVDDEPPHAGVAS